MPCALSPVSHHWPVSGSHWTDLQTMLSTWLSTSSSSIRTTHDPTTGSCLWTSALALRQSSWISSKSSSTSYMCFSPFASGPLTSWLVGDSIKLGKPPSSVLYLRRTSLTKGGRLTIWCHGELRTTWRSVNTLQKQWRFTSWDLHSVTTLNRKSTSVWWPKKHSRGCSFCDSWKNSICHKIWWRNFALPS